MKNLHYFFIILLISPVFAKSRLSEVKERVTPGLERTLSEQSLKLGDPVYLRVFKQERELEVWMKPQGRKEYVLFKTYPIAGMSGELGPKQREGDYQAPEGFYNVVRGNLNPKSSYHLSFNIGYPNAFDKYHKRTGSFIMVHGSNVSVGCYAMTDPVIEVIYLLVEAALKKGQSAVPFHSFPYDYGKKRLYGEIRGPWKEFWVDLEVGYKLFQKEKRPPTVSVKGGKYVIK